ncbi:MAG TPA: nucleoside monophosphate kinase [Isosphaeraceae bacterium]|nr:nucleoside monophosphate kinase [Isosphaeraceae bacterium]
MSGTVTPRHLVVFGRPGSGKSTLATRLGAEQGFQLIQTGELLRAAVRRGDLLGQRVHKHLISGNLVPDRLIFELLEQCLTAPDQQKLLFDGFPRTMGQVTLLENFERKLGFEIERFVEIAISREEAVSRLTGRRICSQCGATYHVRFNPPRGVGLCDIDNTPLHTRPDDSLEVVEVRQQVYDEHALPILDYYSKQFPDRFRRIDGEQRLEAVYEETCKVLGFRPVKH